MKRVLKWLAGIVVALVVIFFAGGYLLPGEAVVQRQVLIAAPPAKVYAIVASMKRFNEFSPWAEIDPNTKYTFEGPESGTGQKMSWDSADPSVRRGSLTIVEVVPDRRVGMQLQFEGMGDATASFELAPSNDGTAVTWGLKASLGGVVERWFGFAMMDRVIGKMYEKGLAKLKAIAEKEAAAPAQ
jgi:carbon monoxide dehydrogenase subunit G